MEDNNKKENTVYESDNKKDYKKIIKERFKKAFKFDWKKFLKFILIFITLLFIVGWFGYKSFTSVMNEQTMEYMKNEDYYGMLDLKEQSLPVVVSDDNIYYLSHNINKEEDFRGNAYIDKNSNENVKIIHHHAAQDGWGGFSELNKVYDDYILKNISFANDKYELAVILDFDDEFKGNELYNAEFYKDDYFNKLKNFNILYSKKENLIKRNGKKVILTTCNFKGESGRVVYIYQEKY